MRWFVCLWFVACGGGADAPDAPIPGGDQASPENVPLAGEGEVSARIQGTIEVPDFKGGLIQLDAVAEVDGQSQVVANERYEEPGEFRLVVRGDHPAVEIVVYLIAEGNEGPGAGDVRFEYPGNPISLDNGDDVMEIEGLVVTVVPEDAVTTGGADAATSAGEPGAGPSGQEAGAPPPEAPPLEGPEGEEEAPPAVE